MVRPVRLDGTMVVTLTVRFPIGTGDSPRRVLSLDTMSCGHQRYLLQPAPDRTTLSGAPVTAQLQISRLVDALVGGPELLSVKNRCASSSVSEVVLKPGSSEYASRA